MANETDDDGLSEFMQASGGPSRGRDKTAHKRPASKAESPEAESNKIEPGKVVQYALNGPGFRPVPGTVATLPPGIYQVQLVNQLLTVVPMRLITDSLLRLPDSKSDEIVREVQTFLTLRDKFKKYGYSHKRGILVWGPPGGGKSCTFAIIIQDIIKMGGLVIMLEHPRNTQQMLADIRTVEPDRPICVIMEDLDAIVQTYGEADTLSLLDGETQIDNVVYLASTNYPEDLDPRITNRPSRFDRVIKIGHPSAEARKFYLESRGLELSEAQMNEWVEKTNDMSIAHLKELIVSVMCFGSPFNSVIERLRLMAKAPTSNEPKLGGAGFGKR